LRKDLRHKTQKNKSGQATLEKIIGQADFSASSCIADACVQRAAPALKVEKYERAATG